MLDLLLSIFLAAGTLAWLLIKAFWVSVVVLLIISVVADLIERFRAKRTQLSSEINKAIIVSSDILNALRDEVKYNPKHERVEKKLTKMIRSREKLMLIELANDNYIVKGLRAKDPSKDDFPYGGVIYPDGEVILYDEDGHKHRNYVTIPN